MIFEDRRQMPGNLASAIHAAAIKADYAAIDGKEGSKAQPVAPVPAVKQTSIERTYRGIG
jgi:hypothetical protein